MIFASTQVLLITGILILLIGLLFMVAGLGGGILELIKMIREQTRRALAGGVEGQADEELGNILEQVLTSLNVFTQTLISAPVWIGLSIFGLLLVFLGAWVLNRASVLEAMAMCQ